MFQNGIVKSLKRRWKEGFAHAVPHYGRDRVACGSSATSNHPQSRYATGFAALYKMLNRILEAAGAVCESPFAAGCALPDYNTRGFKAAQNPEIISRGTRVAFFTQVTWSLPADVAAGGLGKGYQRD